MTMSITPITPAATPDRLTPEEAEYVEAFWLEIRRILGGRPTYRGLDSDDVASFAVDSLIRKLAVKRAFYPDPRAYARLRLRSAAEDLRRRERADAGLGAYGGKTCVSGDTCDFEFEGSDTRLIRDIAELAAERHVLRGLVEKLPADQREIVRLVAIEQYSVVDASCIVGRARETVSRKLNAAYKALGAAYQRATGPAA